MCLDHYLVGKYVSLHQKGDFVRLKLFCLKLKETRIQRKNCFSPLITTRYLHTIVVFFSTRSLNLTHPCTHKQSNNVCLEWAYRRIVWWVPTLASSRRPSAFNKLPKSLLTQYRSWKRETQFKRCTSFYTLTVHLPGCTAMRWRRLARPAPCPDRRPERPPNWCNHR